MPVRLLRDGILDSEAVCSLTFQAEIFYRRLMSVVDDFGRYDGRPNLLRSRLYPLQIDKVREADIPRWIAECETAGLIALYSAAGKPYILFHKLGTPRAEKSKFPPPPDGIGQTPPPESICAQVKADESNGKQVLSDVPYSGSGSGSGSNSIKEPPNPPAGGTAPPGEGDPANEKTIDFGNLTPPPDPAPDAEPAPKKRQARANREPKPKVPRPRNPMYDAIAEVTGVTTGGLVGKVTAELSQQDPPFTPEDVREFSRRYWELCDWAKRNKTLRPTPNEVLNYIGRIRAKATAPVVKRPHQDRDDPMPVLSTGATL